MSLYQLEHELLTEINNLNENKSAGHDEISTKMIKTIGEEIVKRTSNTHLQFNVSNWKNSKFSKNSSSDFNFQSKRK
jgi:hypothetical protein